MSEKFHGQILHFYNLIVCFVSFIMMKKVALWEEFN